MNKNIKYLFIAFISVLTVTISCQKEILPVIEAEKDGYITLDLSVSVPDMQKVDTKAVDPDGGGVQNITLFCFDSYGLFVSTVSANVTSASTGVSLEGKFTAKVPDHVKIVHLVGNQNLSYFDQGDYAHKSEVEVMTSIQASAGRMIYWARKMVDELTPGSTVTLLRNQAKMSVETGSSGFTKTGWIVVNTNAFGTIAPYKAGVEENGGFIAPSLADPFVTMPDDMTKLTSFYDTRVADEEYFFETENSEDDPVEMIIKGYNPGGQELYYRVSLVDDDGNHIKIMRNHHYIVHIQSSLSYGQTTFADALTAPATNNVWISVSDSVKEVFDTGSSLAVGETFVVYPENEIGVSANKSLSFTISDNAGIDESKLSISWLDGNNVAANNLNYTLSGGNGNIDIELRDMGSEQKREGTIFIKYGRLNRKIKVITVKEQNFTPAWITTNIYGVGTGENVTMMFNIPDTFPEELFPLEVLITSPDLDIRNESGMALPVRRKGDPGYGDVTSEDVGYKYVLNVTSTGTQRVYLETILEHEVHQTTKVTIEADYFKTLSKTATFRTEENQYILLHNLRTYSAAQPKDEVIYYHLVPRKKGAIVEFPTHLGKDIVWNDDHTVKSYTAVEAGANDEFLIYSQYLDHNEGASGLDFRFYPISSGQWSTGGRVYGFVKESGSVGATFHMVTNSSMSEEVVRIASNPAGSASVVDPDRVCSGNQYKSAVFELSLFHPFHFNATVNDQGTSVTGEAEEAVDNVMIPYEPGEEVDIEFDVTSFTSSIRGDDNNVLPLERQVSVDPFGQKFKIYIDAPMLEIDETRRGSIPAEKFYEESEGRFVYVVDASRTVESSYGSGPASVVDSRSVDYNGNPVSFSQDGERKYLPFKSRNIVSEGQIVISSEEDKVVFYEKTFNIFNEAITGQITYGASNISVPADAFVPFEVLPTYNRIGAMTMKTDGHYELHLRAEYRYNWDTDDIKLQYVDENGVVYEKTFESLKDLNTTRDINLEQVN